MTDNHTRAQKIVMCWRNDPTVTTLIKKSLDSVSVGILVKMIAAELDQGGGDQVLDPRSGPGLFDGAVMTYQPAPNEWPRDYHEQFWHPETGYPRRVGKADAMRKLDAIKKSGKVAFQTIMLAVGQYRSATASSEVQFIAHPATWLHKGRWEDDPNAIANSGSAITSSRNGFATIAADLSERKR